MGMFSDIDYSLIVLQLEKAMANGVATLNSSAKVPTNQISLTASDVGAIASTGNGVLTTLNAASGTISASVLPSYVDDVLNFANLAAFPVAGETSKIYVTEDNNKTYRWSGSVYVEISSSATAGEALKLTNARTISTTGDATYSISFDGSANVSSAITLANTGVAAGTYNALSTQVRPFTVDSKGRITGVSEAINITPPWSAVTEKPTTLSGYGITNALSLSGGTVTGDLVSTSATASTSTTTGAIRAASLGITGAIFANTVSANSYNLIPVGRGAGGVSVNTAVGVNSLLANTTGTHCSAFGVNSLRANTTGTYCSAFGIGSLLANTTGANCSAFGVYSLTANTTGGSCSAFGVGSLQANTTGNYCSAFGGNAGRFQSDGVTEISVTNNSSFFGMNTKGTQNATNENVFCYNATGNGSNTVTIGDNNIVRTYLKGVVDVANTTPSTSTTTGASVVGGGQGIGGNQHIGGFTSLGGDASHPAVKFMELSGTTAASQGGMALIAHGLNSAKIKAINVLVSNIPSNYVTPGLVSTAGYQFDVAIGVTQILITNIAANSYNILNKPIVVTVFYIA